MQPNFIFLRLINKRGDYEYENEFSMDEIRLKVEEYIKKGGRAAGRPVLTAYYVMTADSTPESEKTNIMIALVAIVFPTSIEDLLGQVFMVGKGLLRFMLIRK